MTMSEEKKRILFLNGYFWNMFAFGFVGSILFWVQGRTSAVICKARILFTRLCKWNLVIFAAQSCIASTHEKGTAIGTACNIACKFHLHMLHIRLAQAPKWRKETRGSLLELEPWSSRILRIKHDALGSHPRKIQGTQREVPDMCSWYSATCAFHRGGKNQEMHHMYCRLHFHLLYTVTVHVQKWAFVEFYGTLPVQKGLLRSLCRGVFQVKSCFEKYRHQRF